MTVEVHPSAIIDEGVTLGVGTHVWHFCHISEGASLGEACVLGQNVFIGPGVRLGHRVKIQNNVSVYSGTEIEDDVFLGPSAVLTNISNPRSEIQRKSFFESTRIRRGATVGANATVVSGVTLGMFCFVAAGAVVTRDVPDYGLVLGTPAKQRGYVSRHGYPLALEKGRAVCPESGYTYTLNAEGLLRCVDLPEDEQLPHDLRTGTSAYRDLHPRA